MDLIKYFEFLSKLNWSYKDSDLNHYKAAQRDYEKAIRLSFLSHDHRTLFLKMKKKNLVDRIK
jgi:hypothetical protein